MGKKIMGGLFELPSTPDSYYNLHDPEKSFESILFRDGYVLQGRELNDLQELFFEHATSRHAVSVLERRARRIVICFTLSFL